MDESLALLRSAAAKAEVKTARLRAQLDAAQKESDELATALRVMERLSGEGSPSPTPVTDNAAAILKHIGYGPKEGRPPIIIHQRLTASGSDLNADLIRTQLWRMAKRGVLESADGKYWRPESDRPRNAEAPDAETSEASEGVGPLGGERGFPPTAPGGSNPSGSTHHQDEDYVPGFADDDALPF